MGERLRRTLHKVTHIYTMLSFMKRLLKGCSVLLSKANSPRDSLLNAIKARLCYFSFIVLISIFMNVAVAAQLPRFLAAAQPSVFFEGADHFGEIDKKAPVVAAYRGDTLLGYVFINSDFVGSIGYSGKPIHMLVAINTDGVLQKIVLVEHHEPIVLIGIPEKKITALFDDYIGRDIVSLARGLEQEHQIDAVSGATVTVMVMDDTVLEVLLKWRAYMA